MTTVHKTTIDVEIFGQQYSVKKGRLDSDYVLDLAAYVNKNMNGAEKMSPASDSTRIAVLAALNIADEYFRCRDGQNTDDKAVKQRVLELVEKLDNAIAGTEADSRD